MNRPRDKKGFVLIVAMVILFAVVSLVLALGRSARTESLASANALASLEAASVEQGAEQFVIALLTDERDTYDTTDEALFSQVPVGTGYFWIIRPDYADTSLPLFGLVDESSKLDLNTVPYATLTNLPGMTETMAASVVDWRDTDDDPTQSVGAESTTYQSRGQGYRAKNAPFESVEELAFVDGFTHDLLYGPPANAMSSPLGTPALSTERYQTAGLFDYFTVWSTPAQAAATGGGATTTNGQINVNQASRDVLRTLTTIISTEDVDKLISQRATNDTSVSRTTTWVATVLPDKAQLLTPRLTGQGAFYSADIVALSGDGRAFKRVRIVVDTTASPVKIVYRRDLSSGGFPLDASIRENLRNGRGMSQSIAGVTR